MSSALHSTGCLEIANIVIYTPWNPKTCRLYSGTINFQTKSCFFSDFSSVNLLLRGPRLPCPIVTVQRPQYLTLLFPASSTDHSPSSASTQRWVEPPLHTWLHLNFNYKLQVLLFPSVRSLKSSRSRPADPCALLHAPLCFCPMDLAEDVQIMINARRLSFEMARACGRISQSLLAGHLP